MNIRKTIRRFIIALALLLGCFVLVLFTSQYWFPWLVPPVLRAAGIEVVSMHRDNRGRIVMDELSYKSETIGLVSKEIVFPNLYQYLSARFISKEWDASSSIEIGTIDLRLEQGTSLKKESPHTPVFPEDRVRNFRRVYESFAKQVPPVSIETLSISNGDLELKLNDFAAADATLSTVLESSRLPKPLALYATLEPDANWTLHAALKETALTLDISMEEMPGGYLFSGQILKAKEAIELALKIEAGKSLPKVFKVYSSGFTLGPSLLSSWRDWSGGSIELQSMQIDWNAGAYVGILQLSSVLSEVRGLAMPVEANIEIEGDLEAMTIQSLDLYSLWAEASLSRPIVLRFEDGIKVSSQIEAAEMEVAVDLSQQSFIDVEGQLKAHVWIPADLIFADPVLRFEVSGDTLAYAGQCVQSFEAAGFFKTSAIVLESASIGLDFEGDSVVTLHGDINLLAQSLDLDYEIKLASEFLNTFLERPVVSNQLWVKGSAEGPWLSPELNFEVLEATLAAPGLNPVKLQGVGRIENLSAFEWNGSAENEGACITSEITGRIGAESIHLELLRLALSDLQLPELVLSEPVSIDFELGEGRFFDRLSVSAFELSGVEKEFSGAFSSESGLSLEVSNLSVDRLNRWLSKPLPSYEFESLTAQITAFDPFLTGRLNVRTSLLLPGEIESTALLQLELGNAGLNIQTLRLNIDAADVAQGNFMLPLRFAITEAGGASWELLTEGALGGAFDAELVPVVVDLIRDATGISIASGVLELYVSGDLQSPTGELKMDLLELDLGDQLTEENLPTIDSLQLRARADGENLEILDMQVSLNQSELEGSMTLPVNHLADWLRSDVREATALVEMLTGKLHVKKWEMENWVDLMPVFFRRSGSLSGSLEISEGLDLSGVLQFQDFALRPTESLSSVDQISGKLLLANNRFELQSTSAQVGGSAVAVTGWVNLQSAKDPLWDIQISGKNIPVFRKTDMILRSDVNLAAQHLQRSGKPLVQGRLDLRASTLLVEFDPLSSSTEVGPGLRPPFFSIDQEPINDWLFDVTIFGESFMRVRSPYFKTKLSADLHLGGSFQEPELVGMIQTVNGELSFPGTKMFIDKGEAFIEPSQPDTVQLDFSGTAQSASYIITMEVSNTLDEPYIQFHSTPELSNTAIVRLLATGTATSGGGSSGATTVGLYLGRGLLGAGGMNETVMDRLAIDVGEERSLTGRQTLDVRFDLNKDWYLNGEYDQYDAYNMNLGWNLFRR